MIPYGRQSISDEDIDRVVKVLRSDYLTQGQAVPEFERNVCTYVGAKYGVAVNSGTSALHIACRALGLGEGDYLWTSPISFVASANCALYCGASVDFVDIDPNTYNMCTDTLKQKLIKAKRHGCLPKVIVPVHFAGLPCKMEELYKLSQEYGFYIVEDASHALGSYYHDAPIGRCQYSDMTVFSFHPVKPITTAEGGMVVTNSENLREKLQLFRTHGITRDPMLMVSKNDNPWYYEQIDLGYNYRMSDIHAALGISQLTRLDDFIGRRREIAQCYRDRLHELPVTLQLEESGSVSGTHLFVIRVRPNATKKSHAQIFKAMRDHGVGVNLHYIPIHLQPYYQSLGVKYENLEEAEKYYAEAMSLPVFPDLTNENIEEIISVLTNVLITE